MTTKRCSRCKLDLPLSEFYRNRSNPDGLTYYCKICDRDRRSLVKTDRRCIECGIMQPVTQFRGYEQRCFTCVPEGMKKCTKCDRVLSKDSFHKGAKWCKDCTSANMLSWTRRNRERHRENARTWRRNNQERVRENQRRYYKEHKEQRKESHRRWAKRNPLTISARNHRYRARLLSAPGDGWAPEQWQAVLDHYAPGGKCLSCGKKRKLTVDHVVMLQDGGANDITNVQPLCRGCNSRRESVDYRPDAGAYAQSLIKERV